MVAKTLHPPKMHECQPYKGFISVFQTLFFRGPVNFRGLNSSVSLFELSKGISPPKVPWHWNLCPKNIGSFTPKHHPSMAFFDRCFLRLHFKAGYHLVPLRVFFHPNKQRWRTWEAEFLALMGLSLPPNKNVPLGFVGVFCILLIVGKDLKNYDLFLYKTWGVNIVMKETTSYATGVGFLPSIAAQIMAF